MRNKKSKIKDKKYRLKIKNQSIGLTLIEVLVALAIFGTTAAIIVDLTLDMMRAEEVAASHQIALDNARFIMQRIAKAIRVSVIKTPSSESPATYLCLEHPRRGYLKYELESSHIKETIMGGDCNTPTTQWAYLDSSQISVENFTFYIEGADNGSDDREPQATLVMKIQPSQVKNQQPSSINIQTTLSQRCLDRASACRAN